MDLSMTTTNEATDVEVLQKELDGLNAAMADWIPRMYAANKEGFEQFADDVLRLRSGAFVGNEAWIAALLVLAKGNLIERLIEHEMKQTCRDRG